MREGGHINALFVCGRCICIVAFDLEKGKECLALHELLA